MIPLPGFGGGGGGLSFADSGDINTTVRASIGGISAPLKPPAFDSQALLMAGMAAVAAVLVVALLRK